MICLSENPPGKRAEVVGMSQGGSTVGGDNRWGRVRNFGGKKNQACIFFQRATGAGFCRANRSLQGNMLGTRSRNGVCQSLEAHVA